MTDIQHDSLIVRTWHEITVNALESRASDIHIEPRSHKGSVRVRVDGQLIEQTQYPIHLHERLITRIKILSRLDIAEKRIPQDGRLSIGRDFSKPDTNCRVSIIPTLYGEKAVVRILPNNLEDLSLEKLGLLPEQLRAFKNALQQTNGLILVTGPTGSGKTRTLYSCLNKLNQVHRNICSIEDPIEIQLPGINQVAYHPRAGLDFPTIIRALLRQDPDVIMIGEIRDAESAQLAIQAAQTGHLVLSTLHTRNASGVLARLNHLGIDTEAIESCLRCISSQRLLRQRCSRCLKDQQNTHCPQCHNTGYFGRIGVHEVLEEQQIFSSTPYLNLYSAGLESVKAGLIDQVTLDAEVGTWH